LFLNSLGCLDRLASPQLLTSKLALPAAKSNERLSCSSKQKLNAGLEAAQQGKANTLKPLPILEKGRGAKASKRHLTSHDSFFFVISKHVAYWQCSGI
jgi:hypothetical protein